MTKRQITRDTPPESCVTIADRLAYSEMIRDWNLQIADGWMTSAPSDSGAVPLPNPAMPWTSGDWAAFYLDSQRTKERIEKREERREKNRALYQRPPKDDEI
jgi:hypothetical protein